MNRLLISAGSLLMLVGAAILASVLLRSPAPAAPASDAPLIVEHQDRADAPSRAWAIAAGGVLAVGAALVGIGMNRWRAPRPEQL